MTLVNTRLFQPNTAIRWCASEASCPKQAGVAVAKPESHIGLEGMDYAFGLSRNLELISNDTEGGAIHIR